MIIKSADDVDVEVTFCDAGYAPGTKPTQLLNTTAVWYRALPDGAWSRSKHRSAILTATDIRHTNASDLHLVSDRKSITAEELHEQKDKGTSSPKTS